MPSGEQSHLYRLNLYHRLEAFWKTVTYTGQELASSGAPHKPSCFSRAPF